MHFLNQQKKLLVDRKNNLNLDFLEETEYIRKSHWKVKKVPPILDKRHVEITGPVKSKMIINALNSGADVYMADFEDSTSPRWNNIIEGHENLIKAVTNTLKFNDPKKGEYSLNDQTAVMFVRPRGLHLEEKSIKFDGQFASASLFDFGVFFYHNAKILCNQNRGPFFYLPKLEHYLEAEWWDKVMNFAEEYMEIPRGTAKTTVLIETLPAAFQMDEILYKLKNRSAGLNCGRWDYIFSIIKNLKDQPVTFSDRSSLTMKVGFMEAYSNLLVKTCHRRGAHAIGGMAAYIPVKTNQRQNELAFKKIKEDKIREISAGYDGTWVAHPGLVDFVGQLFDKNLNGNHNQLSVLREDLKVVKEDLLTIPKAKVTLDGLKSNVEISLCYISNWLEGNGCVPINNLMEDAATAEISRTQVWNWLNKNITLEDTGELINRDLVNTLIDEYSLETIDLYYLNIAKNIFKNLVFEKELADFFTVSAYEYIGERNG